MVNWLVEPWSMTEADAAQVFNGVMLSDGSMRILSGRSVGFELAQGGLDHRDWLLVAKFMMFALGVRCHGPNHYTVGSHDQLKIYSCSNKGFLASQYERWYPNKRKRVPLDIELTPISLANWYMGDGCRRSHYSHFVSADFCTDGFAPEDLDLLLTQLCDLGLSHISIYQHYSSRERKHGRINIHSVDFPKFVEMVRPFTVQSFCYKIKEEYDRL